MATDLDIGGSDAAAGLWLSISDLAARKGVSKQTVAERVSRFEAQGLLTTRPGKGKAKLVNLAEFDRVAGETTDLGREQGAATRRAAASLPSPSGGSDPVYTQEQARKMAYSADREKIALGEDLERLVPVDRLESEFARVLAPIARALTRLSARADDVTAAVGENGKAGARAFLEGLGADISNMIADAAAEALATLSKEAPRSLDDFDPRSPRSLSEGAAADQSA
ncbi:hypothetical protein [Methylobacterium fujisawaense]|uniref:hypothetical protein n=1 Tax=Methylobacterium fujisawaense TaxID=107400 RepID=UPI00313CC6D6